MNTQNNAYILSGDTLTVFTGGRPHVIHKTSQKQFETVLNAIKNNDWDTVRANISIIESVKQYTQGVDEVKVLDNCILFNGNPIHSTLVNRILSMRYQGFDIQPMLKFLTNLEQNPSHQAREELYLFLEAAKLPITEDGFFLAYKAVREDFKDIHSGTFDNSVGAEPKMNHRDVDDNRNRTCSQGLHFASYEYAVNIFGGTSSKRIVVLKINPADVVSIPSDYNNEKGRCCKYLVVEDLGIVKGRDSIQDVLGAAGTVYRSAKAMKQPRDAYGRFTKVFY